MKGWLKHGQRPASFHKQYPPRMRYHEVTRGRLYIIDASSRQQPMLNMPMEAMMKHGLWPHVWRRFKSRIKTRLLIFGVLLAVFLLIRIALSGQ